MQKQISILVGLKNNLDYTKKFYETTRTLYPQVELVFVSHNSTDGTGQWLDSLDDSNLRYYYDQTERTFSETFNKCAEMATGEYVLFAHNDMILAPCFLENIERELNPKHIIIYSTIEPPVFSDHERDGKIIRDFGLDVQTVDVDGIYAFAESYRKQLDIHAKKTLSGSFFMCLYRETLLNIGGLDPLFKPMFREDDDLLIRLKLLGLELYIALDAMCYHFVSKTSRFSEEYAQRTKNIEENSHRNFIRKWHFSNTSPVQKTYDIGFVLTHGSKDLLAMIEPWCSCVYTDMDISVYLEEEQDNTSIALRPRLKSIRELMQHDVMVRLDGRMANKNVLRKIKQINEVIYKQTSDPVSWFDKISGNIFRRLKIRIYQRRSLELTMITRNNKLI